MFEWYIFNSADEIKKLIDSNRMVAIYFSGNSCGACKVIKVKIEHILKKYPNIKACEINGEEHLDIATSYGIFSVPVFLLFIDGKEYIRVGRNLDLLKLERDMNRYYNMIF